MGSGKKQTGQVGTGVAEQGERWQTPLLPAGGRAWQDPAGPGTDLAGRVRDHQMQIMGDGSEREKNN